MRTHLHVSIVAILVTFSSATLSLGSVPAAPDNVRPSWLWSPVPSGHEVMLTWDAAPGATSYNVYLWNDPLGAPTPAALGLLQPQYREAIVPPTPARYVVTAVNGEGESAPSAEAVVNDGDFDSFITAPWPGLYPGTLNETTAWISWYVSNVSGAEGMVDLGTNGSEYLTIYHQTNYQGGHWVWATNLTPLTVYWYRVTTIGTNRVGFTLTNYFITLDSNHPPVADSLNLSTVMAYPLNVPLHGSDNASQVPDLIESFRIVQGPTNGTLSATILPAWNNGAEVLYTPSQNRPLEDHFWYVANDGDLDSAPALVTITNIFYNRMPEGVYTNCSTPRGVAIPIALVGYDPDGDVVTFDLDPNSTSVGVVTGPLTNLLYTPPPTFVGQDYVIYRASDDGMNTWVIGVVVIDVLATNDPPVAFGQSVSGLEDSPQTIFLTAQDPNNDALTYTITTPPAHGTLSGTAPLLTYIPSLNYNGSDAFSFRVSDGQANSPTATVNLTVTPINDAPVASDGLVTTAEDTAVSFTLQASDVEGNPLTYWVVPPTNGVLSGSGAAQTFTPNPNWNGTDFLRFRAHDGFAWSDLATVTIVVTPVNDAPIANAQSVSLAEDTARSITLTGYDVETTTLAFTLLSSPTHGTLTGTPPNLNYTPAANYNGPDSFTFRVSDGAQVSASATVSISVTPVNDPPVASGSSVSLPEDGYAIFGTSGSDPDGDPLAHVITIPPAHGTLTPYGSSGNNWTYHPNLNYNGQDSFTFVVNDGTVNSAAATVQLTVTPVNDMPWITNQTVSTPEDTALNITPLAGDVDGDALTFTLFTPPVHGSVTVNGGQFIYTPAANYSGPDSFEYQAHDPSGGSNTGLISVTVTPVNDAPVANAQSLTINEDTSSPTIALTGSDVEGSALVMTVVSPPSHGTLSGTPPNLTYLPAANYHGPDSFTFKANDGALDSAPATVSIMVTSVNDAPAATPQSRTTPEDTSVSLTLSGTDVDGDALSYAIVSLPGHGTLTGTPPDLVYAPAANYNGADSFTFRVNDGTVSSVAATVSITVTAVNDAPSANGQSLSTPYNAPLALTLTGSDVEGSALTYTLLSSPANGALSGTAPNLTFTPNIGSSGTTSFTFKVNDGGLDSAPATVLITVQAATAVPAVPSGLTATAVSSSQINLTWTDNATNEDGVRIERSLNGGAWSEIGTVGRNVTSYPSTGLSANKLYSYRVRAYNVLGNSGYSATATAKTLK